MSQDVEQKIIAILKIISETNEPIGAVRIAQELPGLGVSLDPRTVRYHLRLMDERGLTLKHGREGRTITEKGLNEIRDALVETRVGTVIGKIETLAYNVTFDPGTMSGNVIVNTSFIDASHWPRVLDILKKALSLRVGISELVAVVRGGGELDGWVVPEGMMGIATVCSVTVNGVLMKQGIPVEARFGGLLEVRDHKPRRFTELIEYRGSSLDPLSIFMKSGMTSVLEAVNSGNGKVLANFREIPWTACGDAVEILETLRRIGLIRTAAVGARGATVLGASPAVDRIGVAVLGGLNAQAALEESGITTQSEAISRLISFSRLQRISELGPHVDG